eukprot:9884571-Alexandrium_andersonii.AAC.1
MHGHDKTHQCLRHFPRYWHPCAEALRPCAILIITTACSHVASEHFCIRAPAPLGSLHLASRRVAS